MSDFSGWGKKLPECVALRILSDLALSHIDSADPSDDRVAELRRLVSDRNYHAICEYKLAYSDGDCVHTLIHLRQALALFQKYQGLPLDIDREAVAYGKFVAAEQQCHVTNQTFLAWTQGRFQFRPCVEAVLHSAQRKISRVLGEAPDVRDLELLFSNGATTDVPKRKSNPRQKLSAGFQCSASLLPLLPALASMMPGWAQFALGGIKQLRSLVRDGQLDFVAKTATTDRPIVKQPSLNVMFQRGVGRVIEDRIGVVGLNTRDQTQNQRLARVGSLDGSLATIDLSSASDTIAYRLVQHLLPEEWLTLLDYGRTPTVRYKGQRIRVEKYSDMGNGFTFPLQTLIFWALASATCDVFGIENRAVAYGDDIIVTAAAAPHLIGVLHDLGFTANPAKSFWQGPFRESCGADYFRGIDIRPWYAKSKLTTADLYCLHNHYVANGDTDRAKVIVDNIPQKLRLFGPCAYGDGHLHDPDFVLRRRQSHQSLGYGGYSFDTLSFGSPKDFSATPGDYIFPSYSVYARYAYSDWEPETPIRDAWSPSCVHHGREPITFVDHQVMVRTRRRDALGHRIKELQWNTQLPGTEGVRIVSIYTLNPSH